MKRLPSRLNLVIAVQVILGTVLYGLGRASLLWPACLAGAAVASLWYTDRRRQFAVGPLATNTAIFSITCLTGWRYFNADGTADVEIMAEAVACLQGVLLFERKTVRTHWDLFSLSLVLVLLSAFLVQQPLFGFGLVAYFFVAFSALALLYLEREAGSRSLGDRHAAALGRPSRRRVMTVWDLWRLLGISVATLLVGPLALFLRWEANRADRDRHPSPDDAVGPSTGASAPVGRPSKVDRDGLGRPSYKRVARPPAPDPASSRWPLAREKALVVPSVSAVDDWSGAPEFWWRMLRLTLGSLAVAVVVFLITPSFGRVNFELPTLREVRWEAPRVSRQRTVGYDDRVRLGDLGTVSESQELVMEVHLTDFATEQAYPVLSELYLRGSVLTEYRDGQWVFRRFGPNAEIELLADHDQVSAGSLVRQRIIMEPLDRSDLFCVWPFAPVDGNPPLQLDLRTERLYRPRSLRNRSFTFELATSAFAGGSQSALTPNPRPVDGEVLRQWPASSLPGLARQASRWLDRSGIPAQDPLRRARYLEQQFHQSRQFGYQLAEVTRSPGVDPVEDFVTTNPQGHCEYFASALALMLRSQGILSRLVLGYRTGDFSISRNAFRVRQADAHAWVEAYIPPASLPAGLVSQDRVRDWSQGAWLRLDPTPASAAAADRDWYIVQQWKRFLEWGHAVWRDQVQGTDATRRRANMYRNLAERIRNLAARLTDPHAEQQIVRRGPANLSEGRLWRGWLAGVGLILCAVLVRARWRPWKKRLGLNRPTRPRAGKLDGPSAIDFYRVLESLLARDGPPRRTSQTPREFAQTAGRRLADLTGEPEVADLAVQVVDAYYCVRFGQPSGDRSRFAAVEEALERIRRALSRR